MWPIVCALALGVGIGWVLRGSSGSAPEVEARDRGFLHHVSLESMMLLRKLGEMGGERYKEYLSRDLNPMVREWLELQLGNMR